MAETAAAPAATASSGEGARRVSRHEVAKMIDHAALRPDMTSEEVLATVAQARAYDVATVCVRPCDIAMVREALAGSAVGVSTVIGFPHGTTSPETKVFEAVAAIRAGAVELDMVLNIGWVRSGRMAEVRADIAGVVAAAAAHGIIVKVILETAYLSDAQIVASCTAAEAAGAAFVKTSTGFAGGGSTPAHLTLMRSTVSSRVAVKASGGLRSLDAVLEAAGCGATRIGTSSTAAILDEFSRRDPTGAGLPLPAPPAPGVSAASAGY